MSKNQTFSGVSSLKSLSASKKVPIKFITRIVSTSQLSQYTPKSVSKHKSSKNSSIILEAPQNKIFKEPKNFSKQLTISTETFSERRKEIKELEQKLASLNTLKSPLSKYTELMTLWTQALNIPNPLSNFFSLIQIEIEEIMKNFTGNVKEVEESKQTLKILKKRFQKLAFENLEVNNLIKEKENSIFRTKEKFKEYREKANKELKEKSENVKQLRADIVDISNDLKEKKRSNKCFQVQAQILKKIVSAVRTCEDLPNDAKEKILSLLSFKDKKTSQNLSISQDFEQSYIKATTNSKYNSFLSSSDIEL